MIFSRRKSIRKKEESITPVTGEFIIKATVRSMRLVESPLGGRDTCVIRLYSHDPILINGETAHEFQVFLSNYHTDVRFNRDRMKFWLCYGYKPAVELDEYEEPQVPLIGKQSCEYFEGRTLFFKGRVIEVGGRREALEIDYTAAR